MDTLTQTLPLRDEILAKLRESSGYVEKEFKAHIDGIFGSIARGEERADSDLDVLVTFGEKASLLDLCGLGDYLEDMFGRKVDVVPRRVLRKEIAPYVFRDLIPI